MAERSPVKEKKGVKCVSKKKKLNESAIGSSIARILEEEDQVRFANDSEKTEHHCVAKERKPNSSSKESGEERKEKKNGETHKVKHSTRPETSRIKDGHDRLTTRRWHSDSELNVSKLNAMTKRSRAKKCTRKQSICRKIKTNESDVKRLAQHNEKERKTNTSKLTRATANIEGKQKCEIKDDMDKVGTCGPRDCSHEKLLNLLLEYFKELTKEVCEFREEKKKMREQIYKLEVSVEKLILRCEAQEMRINGVINQEHRGANNEVDQQSGMKLRNEIQNILQDIHNKYNQRLIEHENRMKCVQEKAENDVQNLMRNIIENYVELKELRGKEEDIYNMIRKQPNKVDLGCGTISINKRHIAYGAAKDNSMKTKTTLIDSAIQSSNISTVITEKLTDHTIKPKKKYEFYFPRQTGISEATTSIDARHSSFEANAEVRQETKDDDLKQRENVVPLIRRAVDSSCYEVTKLATASPASAYFEWKRFWLQKLTQRGNKTTEIQKTTFNEKQQCNETNKDDRNIS